MVRGKLAGGIMFLTMVFGTHLGGSQVLPGEQAPLFRGVDEYMRLVDMADFVDGTPLLFLDTSAAWQPSVEPTTKLRRAPSGSSCPASISRPTVCFDEEPWATCCCSRRAAQKAGARIWV